MIASSETQILPSLFCPFSLKSFKQRLQDHGKHIITLKCDFMRCNFPSQPKNPKTEPSTENESKLVLVGTSPLPDVDMKEDEEKTGAEMIRDSSTSPETKKRILAATLHSTADETSDISSEKRCDAPSSPAKEAAPMLEITSEEPQFDEINGDILKVITEAVFQHNLKKDIRMMAKENMVGFGYRSLKNTHLNRQ